MAPDDADEGGIARLRRVGAPDLAYRWARGSEGAPTVLFLPGFASVMDGRKGLFLSEWTAARGWGLLRFDYRGCGRSGGDFLEGGIGEWRADALSIVDAVFSERRATDKGAIVVGSSMGAWLGVLLALARPRAVRGLVTIAAAPDFTTRLAAYGGDAMRAAHARREAWPFPGEDGAIPIAAKLIAEAPAWFLAGKALPIAAPARLLHGTADEVAPYQGSLDLAARIQGGPATVELITDAGHRLSEDSDLARLGAALEWVAAASA